jgi:energy-coupling factor transporter ATP-binding protein EcfA2
VTSALDADNEELIRAYMHSQAGKKTILVIAHRISTVREADKIALIEDGAVTALGIPPRSNPRERLLRACRDAAAHFVGCHGALALVLEFVKTPGLFHSGLPMSQALNSKDFSTDRGGIPHKKSAERTTLG